MGMMRAPSDLDHRDEMMQRGGEGVSKQPVYCREPGCNWTVWGEAAKASLPKCIRHQQVEINRAS